MCLHNYFPCTPKQLVRICILAHSFKIRNKKLQIFTETIPCVLPFCETAAALRVFIQWKSSVQYVFIRDGLCHASSLNIYHLQLWRCVSKTGGKRETEEGNKWIHAWPPPSRPPRGSVCLESWATDSNRNTDLKAKKEGQEKKEGEEIGDWR